MDECGTSSMLTDRIGCILTYGGSTTDIWINYLLWGANLVWCGQLLLRKRALRRTHPAGANRFRLVSLLGVVLFQIGLCLGLGCSGVSIIWCALAGWAVRQEVLLYPQELMRDISSAGNGRLSVPGGRWMWILDVNDKIWPNMAALVYYGVVAPPITTLAHACALLLGYALSYVESFWFGGDDELATWEDVERRQGRGPPATTAIDESRSGNYQAVWSPEE